MTDDNAEKAEACENLLQLFHRTIEMGRVPNWEGATVSQVCLAQGSNVYVSLKEIYQALTSFKSLPGWVEGNLGTFTDSLEDQFYMVFDNKDFAVEPFRCAEEMFHAGVEEGRRMYTRGATATATVRAEARYVLRSCPHFSWIYVDHHYSTVCAYSFQ
jgi:hypothetical protein